MLKQFRTMSLLYALILCVALAHSGRASQPKLWYRHPASEWMEALPVGNGQLGAMVFGKVQQERIQLNEHSLWSGHPFDREKPNVSRYLPRARKLLFAGKYVQAERLVKEKMMGMRLDFGIHTYQTLGDLTLSFDHSQSAAQYRRELDLSKGIVGIRYVVGGVAYSREIFASAPDKALVIHLGCSQPGSLAFTARLSRPKDVRVQMQGTGEIVMRGVVTGGGAKTVSGFPGVRYQARLRVIPRSGSMSGTGRQIRVQNADAATLVLVASTNYRGRDPGEVCTRRLQRASAKNYSQLRQAHVADHQRLFDRVSLKLGGEDLSNVPTDVRVEKVRKGKDDPGLSAVLFQYGRYLLMASSRPGTPPANLQGMWAKSLDPRWNADYHLNINLEMNYWPAEVCNLPECHLPLFDLIDRLRPRGRATAENVYGCDGFVAHHTTDLWHFTSPVGDIHYGMWPMGAAWLCHHLWEHYNFGRNRKFLQNRAYPAMKEAAQFFVDYLTENPETGCLVSGPSISPENMYLTPKGKKASLVMGPTCDQEIIYDLFTNCIEAGRILGKDRDFRRRLMRMRSRLRPVEIGSHGTIMEWPKEFKEAAPGHRHMSHLFALYPGEQISPQRTPELAEGARKTIQRRLKHGGGGPGWSRAWKVCLYARLHDGGEAYRHLLSLFKWPIRSNLFNRGGVFQIDGNFGATAGIAEMLLQSHDGYIHLLPALPPSWNTGRVTGLRARGDFWVDITWKQGHLTGAHILAKSGGMCKIRCATPLAIRCEGQSIEQHRQSGDVVAFQTEAGREYHLTAKRQ